MSLDNLHTERKRIISILDSYTALTREQEKSASYLKEKLANSESCNSPLCIPEKLVTLGKVVNIRTYFGYRFGLKIVLPEEADLSSRKLSILSEIGAAIYGECEGSEVKWMMGDELEILEILRVMPDIYDNPSV